MAGEATFRKFHVAVSYSRKDQAVVRQVVFALQARGIDVYHDRTQKTLTWGTDLDERLCGIYRDDAHFCVIFLSRDYFSGDHTKIEFDAALERRRAQPDYILPVRLDGSAVPGSLHGVAYTDLGDGITDIAEQVLRKLVDRAVIRVDDVKNAPVERGTSGFPTAAPGFDRTYFSDRRMITNPNLIARCWELSPHADPMHRALLGRDLRRELSYRLHMGYGPAYTAWRADEQTVFAAMLPGILSHAQTTLELRLDGDRMMLAAEWTATGPEWAPIPPAAFVEHLSGLMADRHGCDMGREATLKIVLDRGADVTFPIAPPGSGVETLCRWRSEEPRDIGFDLDRNPLLTDPGIDFFGTAHHTSTGTGMAIYRVQGCWSDDALHELHESFEILLPGRHSIRTVRYGVRRICVYLCNVESYRHPSRNRHEVDASDFGRAMDLSAAALARMLAKERHLPLAPTADGVGLTEPPHWAWSDFLIAEEELDDAEFAKAADSTDVNVGTAEWTKLRQTTGIDVESACFGFDRVISNDELVRYIADREQDGTLST